MSDASPAATPTMIVDPQDPLPESNWFWRRTFVFVGGFLCLAGIAVVLFMLRELAHTILDLIGRLESSRDVRSLDHALNTVGAVVDALYHLGLWLAIFGLILSALYLIAPSAEQTTRWLATVSAWKGGVSTSSISRAVASDGSGAEASNVVAGAGARPAAAPPPQSSQPGQSDADDEDAAPTNRGNQ